MRGREPLVVWSLLALVTVEIAVTYARLPAFELYHVSGNGLDGGLSRAIVFLNFPAALIAIAVVAVSIEHLSGRGRVLAALAAALCVPVFWPGVVRQSNLDARWINACAAFGVFLAFVVTVTAARRPSDTRWDPVRIGLALVALVASPAWLAADLGFFLPGHVYRTAPYFVHHGHHHGMDGVLLVLSALLLSRNVPSIRVRAPRVVTAAYLALMLAYGFGNIANDFWLEQVVKRGWTTWAVPSVLEPGLTWAWGILLAGAIAAFTLWLLALGRGPELREDVGHLERAADGVGGTVDPGLALLDRLDGEDAEGDGHAGLDPGELQA
jgi:hypothetical protein